MRLQSDPTVVYSLTKGREPLNRELNRSDLKTESPFNTYKIDGLPPSPICNPSKSSIHAVSNPLKTDFLFFVANLSSPVPSSLLRGLYDAEQFHA